ncbi:MAG: hypothetical protein WA418_03340 [Bradyrhizobium sp.]
MYTLFRSISLRNFLSLQAPSLIASFVIAELFYKFHSFTLECLAFLATWFVLDAAATAVRNLWIGRSSSVTAGNP